MIDQHRAFRISALLGNAKKAALLIADNAGRLVPMPRTSESLVGMLADLEHELNALFEPPRGEAVNDEAN